MNIRGGMWCVGMAEGGIRLDGGCWRRSCGVSGDISGPLRFVGGHWKVLCNISRMAKGVSDGEYQKGLCKVMEV